MLSAWRFGTPKPVANRRSGLSMNLQGQEGRADIILTPSMNPGNPPLTLTLSPPIRWERRGNPPSPRLRRTGSRRMAAVARKSGRMRQVQGAMRVY